ncbi:MAG: phosphonate ABC transporter, permease protein PhnE [Desulfotomaculum sp.]|nr:phosphonate ABC transporter, permease protein PhnE [Desulfotomaculum sp.]
MAKVAVDRLKEKPLYQRYYQKYLGVGIVFSLILVWSIVDLGIKPQHLWEGLPHFFRLLLEMMPPNWQILISIDIWWAVLETLSMAFVGTVFGALMSFGLALLAANNVTSCRVVREFSKGLLATERAVPTLVIILLLVVVVGLGPFAGMIAIAIGSIGMLGKLFAEAIENTDPKAPESLESVGAGGLQVIRYAVLPQVLPSLIANTLYRFDINIRVAIFLGIVGGGGIGFDLHLAMSLFRYPDALAITAIILIVVCGAEKFSDFLRKKIIGKELLE